MQAIREADAAARKSKFTQGFHARFDEFRLNAYMRVTMRYCEFIKRRIDVIDVGSVEVDAHVRRTGNATRFLIAVEELAKELGRSMYLECVNERRIRGAIEQRGYLKVPGQDYSYWKIDEKEATIPER